MSATTAPSCPRWPSRPRPPWAPTPSMFSPTEATSRARRSWPAGDRRHALRPQVADFRGQGRGPVRQAGLRLHHRGRHLSLPGRRTADPTLHFGGKWHGPARLLDDRLPSLSVEIPRTTGTERRIKRWEHEAVIDAMQQRLDRAPNVMHIRRQTVEHPFGTIKSWMGATHFLTRSLGKVRTEMSLHVLAYNLKRVIAILGAAPLMEAMRA